MKEECGRFGAYLRSHNLKVTQTRSLIFKEIMSSPEVHPNAYELHYRLQEKGHRISLATIYRTLNILVKSGLVSEIDLGENHSHYEPDIAKTAHGHLICLSCGKVREFNHESIQSAIARIGKAAAFQLDKYSIQVFGFCQKCTKS